MKRNRRRQTSHKRNHRSHKAQRSSYFIKRLKYFPAIAITLLATFIWSQPNFVFFGHNQDVLAYATDISTHGLLAATNSQRSANSKSSLTINVKLNNAAQTKANDMVSRNYWSHETPDGKQPWVFITGAGYQYLSAGENLAYGFATSSGTVTGWMNSPSHKANLLSGTFTEVGFGIANSSNFVGNGEQTVVVAMYGKPQVLAAPPAPTPAPTTPAPASKPATKPSAAKPSQQPAAEQPETNTDHTSEPAEKADIEDPEEKEDTTVAIAYTDTTPVAGSTSSVQRVQVLTGGSAIWSATFVILGVCAISLLWLMHRGFRFKKWLKASKKLVGKHLHLDLAMLAIIYLGFVLLSTSGAVL